MLKLEPRSSFDTHEGFNRDWWLLRPASFADERLALVDEAGAEVARIHLVDRTYPGEYIGVTESQRMLKIHLLEVREDARRVGVGTTVLTLLSERYPNRALLAFSEADDFWESVGWVKHIHKDDDPNAPRHQLLYIQPSR